MWGKKKEKTDFHKTSFIYPYKGCFIYATQVAQFYYKFYFPTCSKTLCKEESLFPPAICRGAGVEHTQNLKIKFKFSSSLLSAFQKAQEPSSEPSFQSTSEAKLSKAQSLFLFILEVSLSQQKKDNLS